MYSGLLISVAEAGELVTGAQDKRWREMWEMAQADSFAPAAFQSP